MEIFNNLILGFQVALSRAPKEHLAPRGGPLDAVKPFLEAISTGSSDFILSPRT